MLQNEPLTERPAPADHAGSEPMQPRPGITHVGHEVGNQGPARGGQRTPAALRAAPESITPLAMAILGTREREVLLARWRAKSTDVSAVRQLAEKMRISVKRVYELEASARRKLARAVT